MRIISADSSAAILNEKFEAQSIVAASSVLVSPPYREADEILAEPIFVDMEKSQEVILHEAELCRDLIARVGADVVYLDMSLNSISLEQLSPIEFSSMRISNKARRNLLKVLPRLRKIAGEIKQKHAVEVLAIGKESIPVRIAELTSGAHAILYACKNALDSNERVLLGLPSKCQARRSEEGIHLCSLITSEFDVGGYAEDRGEVLKKINMVEMLNPSARGFRILKITPRSRL